VIINTSSEFHPQTSQRTFRICISDYLSIVLFAPLLRRLAHSAPRLRYEFIQPTDDLPQQIDRGDVELVISPAEYLNAEHPNFVLYEETFVLVGSSQNPLFQKPITIEEFRAAEHVAVRLGRVTRTSFAESQLRAMGMERASVIQVTTFGLVPELLIETDRVAIMHKRLAEHAAEKLPLRIQALPFPFPPLVEAIQFHRSRINDAGLKWLVNEIRQQVRGRPSAAERSPPEELGQVD
jgi:DNA-binding transcriptional LysR family regulator